MQSTRRTLLITAIVLAIVVLTPTLFYYWVILEHDHWTETIHFVDGTTAKAQFKHSARRFWSTGMHGGIGGGDDHYWVRIQAAGKHFTWAGGDERPIVFGLKDEKLFMTVFDRSDMDRIRYRYYRSDSANRLLEIVPSEFPKELAVQNSWLDEETSRLLRSMDPEDVWFQQSLTARMWLHLVNGVDYSSLPERASPQFIAEYKSMYLKATPVQPTSTPSPVIAAPPLPPPLTTNH